MPRIIAYQHDAATYCIPCTVSQYGQGARVEPDALPLDANGVPSHILDGEGNEFSVLTGWDDWCDGGYEGCILSCDTCYATIAEHDSSFHGFCPCGDGCDEGDCMSCAEEDDEDEDDDEGSPDSGRWNDGCHCDNCVAAAAWVIQHPDGVVHEARVVDGDIDAPEFTPDDVAAYLAVFAEPHDDDDE